jgi:phenylalanyl-tRNA synthetase beta chain
VLVPLSWLCDFAPIDADLAELVDAFNDLGMVVDGVRQTGRGMAGVIVAEVLSTRPHPNADRVQLVEVDAGDGEATQIVCGAFNFGPGDRVPLAPTGTHLPEVDLTIERRKVRGEWSNGMLCSGRELGLSDDASGIYVLAGRAAPGTPLAEALGMSADVVFDLDIGVNRPDAMSMAGVARDLAAWLKVPFTLPDLVMAGTPPAAELTSVVVEAPELCPRFTARVLTGVRVAPSEDHIARRLALAGMRPINNVVDASNYVMLELGQPTHPYDLALLPGHGFVVRRARPGETLVTLDGVARRLGDGDDCLICDAESTPIGIGGIMGGASSEISEATTEVVLEAAYFTPMVIARTSKRLGLRTEASARFERGCDVEGIERASGRFCEIVGVGETSAGWVDVRAPSEPSAPVRLRTARVNALLGTRLSDDQIRGYLEPIGFGLASVVDGVHAVTIPSFRPDSSAEIDLVEEVARHHGYARLGRTVPVTSQVGGLSPYQRDRRRVRQILTGAGVTEAMGTMLLGPGDHARAGLAEDGIAAADPMVREESILRTSLRPGLLRALEFNTRHRMPGARLFEIGHVYRRTATPAPLPDEREHLAVALATDDGAIEAKRLLDTLVDALRLLDVEIEAADDGDVPGLHPTRTAHVVIGGERVGEVGEVDPDVARQWDLETRVGWIGVDLERLLAAPRRPAEITPVTRFPSSDLDLAFVVDDAVPAGAVEATIRQAAGELLESLQLFDTYRGAQMAPGRRSLAYRLRLRALDRTLTDDELARARQACITAVESTHPANLRQ